MGSKRCISCATKLPVTHSLRILKTRRHKLVKVRANYELPQAPEVHLHSWSSPIAKLRKKGCPRKVLFAPYSPKGPEHGAEEEIRELADCIQARDKAEFLERWNFDVDEEKPVPGQYQWESE